MYEFTGRVRFSETDSDGNLSLESLLDYFQDSSTFQSESLGVGMEHLKENHMAWVLSSWQIVVERYPKLCEEVTVGTLPYDFKGFLGNRNFYMKDQFGERVACANSLWVLISTDTLKPILIPEEIIKAYPKENKIEMDYAPRKIVLPTSTEEQELNEKEVIVVKPYHLDTNHHVNNGQYIRMAMGFLPEFARIKQLRAEYKKSAYFGDSIYPRVFQKEDCYLVSLQNEEKKPYVNIEFTLY